MARSSVRPFGERARLHSRRSALRRLAVLPSRRFAVSLARVPIRWRLTVWYAGLLAGALLLFGAAIYFARETPCGPRVIGVRLGDLLNWLTDPQTAPKRDFLGMLNGGC